MSTQVLHSTLYYRHDGLANERLGVAVLVVFPETGEVELLSPSRVELQHRLKHAYTEAPISLIWQYVCSFRSKATKLNGNLRSYLGNFEHLISDHFLTENGASLFFDDWKVSPLWKDELSTKHWLQRQLLGSYARDHAKQEDRITEQHITKQVRSLLRSALTKVGKSETELYLKEEKREVSLGIASITSDSQWKNGSLNLIHALSLDVLTVETLRSKTLTLAKSAEELKAKAVNENLCFHVILSKPHRAELQSAYRDAVKVLEDADAPLKVVVPTKIEAYSRSVAKDAKPVEV
jgi:hypothetical protein